MAGQQSLDEVRTFLLQEFNSEPIFYSSDIFQRRSDSCRTVSFKCVLERRRGELEDVSLIRDHKCGNSCRCRDNTCQLFHMEARQVLIWIWFCSIGVCNV